MPDLSTRYLGLELRSPLVASASPLTGEIDWLLRLEDAGVGAVVLPSLFEEQIEHEALEIDRLLSTGAEQFLEASNFFPQLDDYNTGPERYLAHITAAKGAISIPVIASLNGTTPGGWTDHARRMEEAGADALELNVYNIAADPRTSSQEIEDRHLELVASVVGSVDIPVAVKIGPFYSALAHMACRFIEVGAEGIVCFNRFYQPDIDLERFEVVPRLVLSTSEELRLILRWIAILRGSVSCSLAATTGIHSARDVAKAILAGADVTMMASVLLKEGIGHVRVIEEGLSSWMTEEGYQSVEQMRGSMSQGSIKDPAAFERANYMKTIITYSSTVHTA